MSIFDPRIDRHLIADQGEVVIDEVHKHWAAIVGASLELFGGTVLLLLVFFVPAQAWWVPVLIGGAVMLHAGWRILERRTDVFVITNMRVFRVHGILAQNIATMPLARILDISVHKPVIGRVLGYGHFVFESAAQEQGLREIRFVGDPDGRGSTIQRVIQQAGLRGFAGRPGMAPGLVPGMPGVPVAAGGTAVAGADDVPPRPVETAEGSTARLDAERRGRVAVEESGGVGWDWLAVAQRREQQRLSQLRGEPQPESVAPFDPDRTSTAPIDLPR